MVVVRVCHRYHISLGESFPLEVIAHGVDVDMTTIMLYGKRGVSKEGERDGRAITGDDCVLRIGWSLLAATK